MFIPMINIIIIKFYYLQIQEYEILKYIPYVHSSCVRKRILIIIIIIIIIIIMKVKNDHRSKFSNLSIGKKKPEKN